MAGLPPDIELPRMATLEGAPAFFRQRDQHHHLLADGFAAILQIGNFRAGFDNAGLIALDAALHFGL